MFKKTGLIFRFLEIKGQLKEKNWYLSRTIWFNILTLTFSVLAIFGGIELGVTDNEVNNIAIGLVAISNIVLRFLTNKPVVLHKGNSAGKGLAEDEDNKGNS